jgi:hypothetical protein
LNLPHASRIASRIEHFVRHAIPVRGPEHAPLLAMTDRLQALLGPIAAAGENPPPQEAAPVVQEAAELGRRIVDMIESLKLGHDRLGQAVRNLFECLELGEEGARISLRAGERPDSALRA